ncbi:MAG TPA: amino acid adenylation domain-containing protein [Ktedonobacterales bacterium]|jgi:amino acid adenylation domain-containing protein
MDRQDLTDETSLASKGPASQQTPALYDTNEAEQGLHPYMHSGDTVLSLAQERWWFLEQLTPGLPTAYLSLALRVRGMLDQDALERSINTIVQRHEVLRTSFTVKDGQPLQMVSPFREVRLPVLDVAGLPANEQESVVRQLTSVEAQCAFDLSHDPLLRAGLLRLAAHEHILLVALHHLAADEESLAIFFSELTHLYAAFSQGTRPQLPELPIQYADYTLWQREWLHGAQAAEHLAYWRQQLREVPAVLDLPTDHSRPATTTFEAARQVFLIPRPVVEALEKLSQQEEATLLMTLLAAFNVLLSRYSRQADILVGVPSAGRSHLELKHLVGPFATTLALRTHLADNPAFRQVLQQVRKATLEAYTHQSLPFDSVVEMQQQNQHPGTPPLLTVLFALRDAPLAAPRLPGVQTEWMEMESTTTSFDLSLICTETQAGLQGVLEYKTQLFEAAFIERMAGHLQVLLAGIAANPAQRLSDLPLLTTSERQQLLVEWNNAQMPYPAATLHQLFEARAAQAPQAIALACGEEQLTYDELNRRANQIAHVLQGLGVGPETTVGLLLERSPDLVVGLLGILKSGGAYVPLDPAYPQERLAFTLQNARAPVLLTQQRLLSCLPEQARQECALVCLDVEQSRIAEQQQENVENRTSPANLAYIIYTSGSTGQPKGVAITHQSAVILVYWAKELFPAEDLTGVLASTSVCFDLSIFELFVPLTWGGKVILAENALQLPAIAQRESVTLVNTVPSAMAELVRSGGLPATVRTVNLAGEALPRHLVDQIYASTSVQRVFNLYGPTEDTTYSTWAELAREAGSPVSIGRPLPNTSVYLLDEAMQPVPVGVPGELYLGGKGLARGYFQRSDLTAERFVPDPFSSIPGARLYRTGDLACYRPDGRLDYLGRIDHQVKIRGFRIEPGEVEAALMRHASVRQCLVLAREARPGEKRLVAYLVPANQQERPTTTHLRRHVQQLLPEYMIPAAFVWLNEMPLTANGKIDRKALPMPARSRPEQEEAFVAPATPLERNVAAVWAEVLGLDAVGVLDNFFALGGDSIRSLRVVALLKQQGVPCSLTQLFHHQTVRKLAEKLAHEEPVEPATLPSQPFALIQSADVPRLPSDLEDAYPATQLQLGMLFHSTYEQDSAIYHNLISLHLRAPFNQHHLEQALQVVAARHPVLRTSFDLNSFSEPLQLIHRAAHMSLDIADLRHLPFEEQEQHIQTWFEAEKKRKFTWTQAPLARFQAHRRTEETFQLTFTDHHAILDGWSEAVLLTEVLRLYVALQEGQEPLAEATPSLHFRDYALLERSTTASEAARHYWQEKLGGATSMKLPRLGPRQQTAGPQQREIATLVPREVVRGLRQLASQASVPLKSALLAAHLRVMSLLSGEADILTGVAADGRLESAEDERVLGLFLNTVPFRQKLSGGTWMRLVQETFERELEFLPFRRYPLGQIQLEHGGQPLFETVFNYTHFHVYQRLHDLPLEVLGTQEYAETNFAFVVTFNLDAATSDLHLVLQYKTAEFSEEQMQTIAGYYMAALKRMAQEPTERYEAQVLLSPAEEHLLLREWNNTDADYPRHHCIHQVFEQQVSQTPDAVAAVFEDQTLTYQALNMRANQLAHYLQQLGVGPDVRVGLCLERSMEMVVGLLGALKAGGAYVPLDPAYPANRLAFMLQDSQAAVLLTQEHLCTYLPKTQAKLICLDTQWEHIAGYSKTNIQSGVNAGNLAYVIYTSGSTGQPKGVCCSHSTVLNLLSDFQRRAPIGPGEVCSAWTSVSFDVSVYELFSPLIAGATLQLVPEAIRSDGAALFRWLHSHHVRSAYLPPFLLADFARWLEQENERPPLSRLLVGVEPIPEALLVALAHYLPGLHVINGYGPTETTICATLYEINPAFTGDRRAPIGRPAHNTTLYVLDQQLQLVPVGIPGELYIGGEGLARGYLNRPDLTAERFIPDPFSDESNARLYKTGDLVRYLPDGNLVFLGRLDHQVKVRGFRVELEEIENRLGQHPGIREAIVLAREGQPGEKQLVAYVVPHQQSGPSRQELRSFLREHLPEYMVPAAFVFLDRLPLSPNGKIDVRALPTPEGSAPELANAYRAPRTPVEESLAAIWADLFQMQRVGVDDNFFELGGHSLLAMQAITRVRATLGVNPPVRMLFESPTVARFAQALAMYEATPQQSRSAARPPQRITKMSVEEIQTMLPQKRRNKE